VIRRTKAELLKGLQSAEKLLASHIEVNATQQKELDREFFNCRQWETMYHKVRRMTETLQAANLKLLEDYHALASDVLSRQKNTSFTFNAESNAMPLDMSSRADDCDKGPDGVKNKEKV